MPAHIWVRENGKDADGVVDRALHRVIVEGGIVAPVAEVEMLCNPGPQRLRLPNVSANMFVKPEDPIQVDCTRVGAEIAAYGLEPVVLLG